MATPLYFPFPFKRDRDERCIFISRAFMMQEGESRAIEKKMKKKKLSENFRFAQRETKISKFSIKACQLYQIQI
jgi:hypothetical protein